MDVLLTGNSVKRIRFAAPYFNKNKIFHIDWSVYQKLFAETGVLAEDGRSVVDPFPVENFTLAAHFIGTVAMIPDADNMIDSKFLITFKPLPILNGKRAVSNVSTIFT